MIVAKPSVGPLATIKRGRSFFYFRIQGLICVRPVCADDGQLVSVERDPTAIFPGSTMPRPGIQLEERAFCL